MLVDMRVDEVMTRWPVVVHPGTTVREALRMLDEHAITAMPVVDDRERVVGVVSEGDLVRDAVVTEPRAHLASTPRVPHQRRATVGDLMSRPAVTVRSGADLAEAVDLMTTRSLKSLPVVDDAVHAVGMLSGRDVVHLVASSDEQVEHELAALFELIGVDWRATAYGGAVTLEGPVGERARSLARIAGATVPGVTSVEIVDDR